MIKALQAATYADHQNRIRTFEEVLTEIAQLILDSSLAGYYFCDYPVSARNVKVIEENKKNLKVLMKESGYIFNFMVSSSVRDYNELVSLNINWMELKS